MKQTAIVVVTASVALLGLWLLLERAPETAVASSRALMPPPTPSSPPPEGPANAPGGDLRLDSSSRGKPLRDIYAALKARADAGEVGAACTLAFQLNSCDELPALKAATLQHKRQQLELLEGSPSWLSKQALIQQLEAKDAAADVACEGFPQEEARHAWKYLLLAAQAGHPESMLRFLWMLGLNRSGASLDYLDQWNAYRDHAPAILEQAVARGYPEAYEVAVRMYTRDYFGRSPVPRDVVKAHAFDLALARAGDADRRRNAEARVRMRAEKGDLDQAQLARAEALAAPLAARLDVSRPRLSVADGGCNVPYATR